MILKQLPVGTRSLLFGVHQLLLHPLMVALAWKRLYGMPKSLPLWVSFFLYDVGYWGKPNMDGEVGRTHPELGARIMTRLFGPEWGEFTLHHSRQYVRQEGGEPSRLCVADKLAPAMYPAWLYLWLGRQSGEIHEYMEVARDYVLRQQRPIVSITYLDMASGDPARWHKGMVEHLTSWAYDHRWVATPEPTRSVPDNSTEGAKTTP